MEARRLADMSGGGSPEPHAPVPPHASRLRIAFVVQPRDAVEATSAQRGSIATITWELARRLAQRHDVTIYAPRMSGQLAEERSAEGVIVRRVPRVLRRLHKAIDRGTALLGMHPPYFTTNAFFREYANAIGHSIARDPPDVVHVQICSQFLPVMRRAAPHARIIFHAHDELLTRLDPPLMTRRLATADAVVTCSDYVTYRWRERFTTRRAHIFTIGNGVDLERFRPRDASAGTEREPLVIYVGRVSPEKGVHVLAQAFEEVLAEVPDARLLVLGSAGLLPFNQITLLEDDPYIASLTEFYGHSVFTRLRKQVFDARRGYVDAICASVMPATRARIEFHGPQEYLDLPLLYRRAALLVAPSLCAEPFGLPLAEAMASGLPVIASRSGGMPGIVEHGRTGCLVERGDVGRLADMMVALLSDPQRLHEMGRAARVSAEARFGWRAATERLESVYRSVSEPVA
jgi:glycosyltransferase involved in cell wall biosynthesis